MPINIEHPVIDSLGTRMQALRFPIENDLEEAIIEAGEWLPDRGDVGNPGVTVALNVLPDIDGYRPQQDLAVVSDAADARVQGGGACVDAGGATSIYIGDKTKLYRLNGALLTDVSGGTTFATPADLSVEFTCFGDEVLSTNFQDPVQKVTAGVGTTFSDSFTSTLKPKARHIATLRDQIILGGTQDAVDGSKPNRVWWGGLASSVDMDPSAVTQSDFQDVQDAGFVQKVVGGAEYGLVFMEEAIERMDYVGSPLIYEFSRIDRKRGALVPNSVIGFGRYVFFWSPEGVFMTNGVESVPIGQNKVDRWLLSQLTNSDFPAVSSAIDPVNKLVAWSFPGTGSSGITPNTILYYEWVDKRFSYVTGITHTRLIDGLTRGSTLDSLDADVGTDIDDAALFPYSFDSGAYSGGQRVMQAVDASNQIAEFTGANLAATIDSKEVQLFPGFRARTSKIRPITESSGSSVTLTAGAAGRERQNDTVTFDTLTSQVTDGFCPSNNSSRYHRFRTSIAAGGTWEKFQGWGVKAIKEGTL